jgi:hypothetical protein
MDTLAGEHCDQTQIKRKSGPGELLVRVPRPLLEQTSLTRNTHLLWGRWTCTNLELRYAVA